MYYNLYQIEFKNIELSNKALKLANDRFEEHHNEQIKLLKDEQSKSNDERLKAEKFRLTSEKQHNKLINKIDEQSAQIDKLLGFAESTDNRLKIIAPNHVEITRLTYDQCYKCVILKHTKETDIMPYYVIRSQVKSIDEAIKTQQIKYSNRLIVIHTSDQPNPIAFFNIIKSELKDNIKINKNWFSLNDMTDIEFKNKLIDINSRRTKTI
jgi:lactam utilization protein B